MFAVLVVFDVLGVPAVLAASVVLFVFGVQAWLLVLHW